MPVIDRPVYCRDCDHDALTSQCVSTPDGLTCPACHVPGAMVPCTPLFFERGGQWFWTLGASYPWGPFRTEAIAKQNAGVRR